MMRKNTTTKKTKKHKLGESASDDCRVYAGFADFGAQCSSHCTRAALARLVDHYERVDGRLLEAARLRRTIWRFDARHTAAAAAATATATPTPTPTTIVKTAIVPASRTAPTSTASAVTAGAAADIEVTNDDGDDDDDTMAVSYTHLTLPTIYSV